MGLDPQQVVDTWLNVVPYEESWSGFDICPDCKDLPRGRDPRIQRIATEMTDDEASPRKRWWVR